jgi:hypothetical protein
MSFIKLLAGLTLYPVTEGLRYNIQGKTQGEIALEQEIARICARQTVSR